MNCYSRAKGKSISSFKRKLASFLPLILLLQYPLDAQTFIGNLFGNSDFNPTLIHTSKDLDPSPWSDWTLIFHDEFNENALNRDKWITYYPAETEFFSMDWRSRLSDTAKVQQVFLDENVVVGNGICRLVQKQENASWAGVTQPYTAGMLHGKKKFHTYSKYEIRCKLPKGAGLWSAFWMFGWSTEIDVFEFNGAHPEKLYSTLHYWHDGWSEYREQHDSGVDYSTAFHTFAVEFDPDKTVILVDGIERFRFYRYYTTLGFGTSQIQQGQVYYELKMYPEEPNSAQSPWTCPVNIIAGSGISRDIHVDTNGVPILKPNGDPITPFDLTGPDANTVFPNYYDIDYIRVFQRKGNIQNQWTHDLNSAPMLQGRKVVCPSSSVTYSVYNPSNSPLTYTSSNNVNILNSTNTNVTFSTNGLGDAWIEATRAANHPISASVGRFEFWIGKPVANGLTAPPFGCTMGEVASSIHGYATQYQWNVSGGSIVGNQNQSSIWVDPVNGPYGFTAEVIGKNICGWSNSYDQFFSTNCPRGGGPPTPLRVVPHGNTLDVDLSAFEGQIKATYLQNVSSGQETLLTVRESISGVDVGDFKPGYYVFIVETTEGKRVVSQQFVYY